MEKLPNVSVERIGLNSHIVTFNENQTLLSYNRIIGVWNSESNVVILNSSIFRGAKLWENSTTTSKHRNQWLQMTTKEIHERISSGQFVEVELGNDEALVPSFAMQEANIPPYNLH
ncbi:hypothetical protein [uncultured Mediterranean phage uvMED]|nr:hypothetical protein [uncultured Mediterranean phage uvMED]|tara:strand:- start:2123 stop:2470 length:348 start_codon:yes stop_codon:yes gene_type:complete